MLQDDSSAPAISHMAITEVGKIALPCFLMPAHDGTARVPCFNSQLSGIGQSVFVPSPSGTCRKVDDISFLSIMRSSSFDSVILLLACCWSPEVDWLRWIQASVNICSSSLRRYYDAPERQPMSAKGDAVEKSILASGVKPRRVVSWQVDNSTVFEGASIMLRDALDDSVDIVAPEAVVSANVRPSHCVDFLSIQTHFRQLRLNVPQSG